MDTSTRNGATLPKTGVSKYGKKKFAIVSTKKSLSSNVSTTKKRKIRMGPSNCCCVVGCPSRGSRDFEVTSLLSFHTFPRIGTSFLYVTDENGVESLMDRKHIWEMILLMEQPASPNDRVCSLHFQKDDYHNGAYLSSINLDFLCVKLYSHAIPTLNLPQTPSREYTKECSVKCCGSSERDLYVLHPPETLVNITQSRWYQWRTTLGISSSLRFMYTPICVCTNHFTKGAPSEDPNDLDYIPNLFLEYPVRDLKEYVEDCVKTEISSPEFVEVEDYQPVIKEEPPEFSEISSEFIEDSIKIEPIDFEEVDVKLEPDCVISSADDHTYYCKF